VDIACKDLERHGIPEHKEPREWARQRNKSSDLREPPGITETFPAEPPERLDDLREDWRIEEGVRTPERTVIADVVGMHVHTRIGRAD
jgi:hypothetical protein